MVWCGEVWLLRLHNHFRLSHNSQRLYGFGFINEGCLVPDTIAVISKCFNWDK